MEERHSAYRVPTRRPFLLRELYDKLPSVDDRVRYLPDPADPTEYEAIADTLYELFQPARNLAQERHATGCDHHPKGPIDTEAPEGWSRCLLCNHHRRIGRPHVKAAAADPPRHLWSIPDPPYTHALLLTAMLRVNDIVSELNYRSAEDLFQQAADRIHEAFTIARELSRPRTFGCPQHPGAPIDPTAPDGPRCLFCQARERRSRQGPPSVEIRPCRPVPVRGRPRTPPTPP